MTKITPNFQDVEFTCRCGCGYMAINPDIVNRLQVIRDIIGLPIKINSGCRCEKHNKEVGGAPNSYHLRGMAIDWTVEEYHMATIARLLKDWSGGFHFYEGWNFIHIDMGERRRW